MVYNKTPFLLIHVGNTIALITYEKTFTKLKKISPVGH